MKNKIFILILPLIIIFIFNGKKYEQAVIDRLLVPIKICLEGEDCGSTAQISQSSTPSSVSVEKIELSQGSEHTIKMLNSGEGGQMIFEPAVIKVSKGDTIHFKASDMSHNSASIDGMVPDGANSWSGQMNMDISITLDTEGIYVYQCDPHVMMAMVGVIQVGDAVNLDNIKASAADKKSAFMLNSERLDEYLAQL